MYQFGSVLSVPKGLFYHKGMYVGEGLVFHNHPSSGERLVSLSHFSQGRPVTVDEEGVSEPIIVMSRLKNSLARPSPYKFFKNCEQTVSKLRTGVSCSPQLRFFGLLGVIGLAAITISFLKRR